VIKINDGTVKVTDKNGGYDVKVVGKSIYFLRAEKIRDYGS